MGLSGVYGEAICRKQALLVSHYRRAFGAHVYACSRPCMQRETFLAFRSCSTGPTSNQRRNKRQLQIQSRGSIDAIVFETRCNFATHTPKLSRPPFSRVKRKKKKKKGTRERRKERMLSRAMSRCTRGVQWLDCKSRRASVRRIADARGRRGHAAFRRVSTPCEGSFCSLIL